MAGSSVSSDAKNRFAVAVLHAFALVAIAISLFATGRSASGFALAQASDARIGPLWTYDCSKSGPCWGTGDQAENIHLWLLITHATSLGLVALALYHSLITRRPLKYSAKGRCISFLTMAACLAMASAVLLLLNATGFAFEPGLILPGIATLAETGVFGTLLTLCIAAPPESAETRHGTTRMTRAEEARRHRNGFWLNQYRHLPQEKRKSKQAGEKLPAYNDVASPEIDAVAVFGDNDDRMTIGQILHQSKNGDAAPEMSMTNNDRTAKAPKQIFLEPPSDVSAAPTLAHTHVISAAEFFDERTMAMTPRRPPTAKVRPVQKGAHHRSRSRDQRAADEDEETPASPTMLTRQSSARNVQSKRPLQTANDAHASPPAMPKMPDEADIQSVKLRRKGSTPLPISREQRRTTPAAHVLAKPARALLGRKGSNVERSSCTDTEQTDNIMSGAPSQARATTSPRTAEDLAQHVRGGAQWLGDALAAFGKRILDSARQPSGQMTQQQKPVVSPWTRLQGALRRTQSELPTQQPAVESQPSYLSRLMDRVPGRTLHAANHGSTSVSTPSQDSEERPISPIDIEKGQHDLSTEAQKVSRLRNAPKAAQSISTRRQLVRQPPARE